MPPRNAALVGFSPQSTLPPALEAIERDAWLDAYRAADERMADALRMAHAMQDGIGLTAMRAIDFGLFNRAQGLGCERPLFEADVRAAVTWLESRCAPSWRLQLVPSALPDDFQDRAAKLGLAPKGRGPAKLSVDDVRALTGTSSTWASPKRMSARPMGQPDAAMPNDTADGVNVDHPGTNAAPGWWMQKERPTPMTMLE